MGVVKRWVLRGLWRRLVGVGIIGPGLLGAPASIMPLAALCGGPSPSAAFALPGPMRQCVSYVHHVNLYIRNIIPIGL